jgi:acyl-CoA reductase-like NAD-dependent aldehyde dehydrogenase
MEGRGFRSRGSRPKIFGGHIYEFLLNTLLIVSLQNEQEGVKLANDCKYGLGAGIWTSDLSRAHRVAADIQAGLCWINTHHRNDPSSPWYMFQPTSQCNAADFHSGEA